VPFVQIAAQPAPAALVVQIESGQHEFALSVQSDPEGRHAATQ
jgi:hypothetical protein